MHKFFRRLLLIFIFIFFIICTNYFKSLPLYQKSVNFKSCIDGDTAVFIINDENVTVRFLAIDAPENNTQIISSEELKQGIDVELKDYFTAKVFHIKKV